MLKITAQHSKLDGHLQKIRIPSRKGNGTTATIWYIGIYFLILPLTFALLHVLYKVSLPDFL